MASCLQATAELSDAQQQAAKAAAARARLEADLAGCRSWIRELERTEQQYLKTIRYVRLAISSKAAMQHLIACATLQC
jgi:chaperonin cofactor prefoldin